MSEQPETSKQPFLPRVGLIWFFIVATLIAIALGIVRAADQGQALAAAMVGVTCFVVVLAMLSGGCFAVAYMFGAMERAVAGNQEQISSPFIDGSFPDQIIPPQPVDEN